MTQASHGRDIPIDRENDVWLAEHVLRWTDVGMKQLWSPMDSGYVANPALPSEAMSIGHQPDGEALLGFDPNRQCEMPVPHFHTRLADAYTLLDVLCGPTTRFRCDIHLAHGYATVTMWDNTGPKLTGTRRSIGHLARAIAFAALQAVMLSPDWAS